MSRYIVQAVNATVNEGPRTVDRVDEDTTKYVINAGTFVVNEYIPCNDIKESSAGAELSPAECPEDVLPGELLTPEAREVWSALVAEGFLDERWQPAAATPKNLLMYIALEMSERFLRRRYWKPFELLWQQPHMAQTCQQMTDCGRTPRRAADIERIVRSQR